MNTHIKSMVEDQALVARRRSQLVEAAIPLFCRVGYAVATVKDVAIAANVSTGLVYQYVPDKEQLLFLCLLHIVERSKQEIPKALEGQVDPMSRLICAVEAYTKISATNRRAILLTYRETKSLKPESIAALKNMELETNAMFQACLEECMRNGYLEPVHSELLTYRIVFSIHAWALKHWRLSEIVSLEEYTKECVHACWTVLLTRKGKFHYAKIQGQSEAQPDHKEVAGRQSGVKRKAG